MNGRSRGRLEARALACAALAATILLAGGQARAQENAGTGWLPWLGCWTEVGEAERVVCVQPTDGRVGAEVRTIRDGETVESETLRADGVRRDVVREGCEGSERADLSPDGHRVYLRFDYVCEGGVERRGTGLVAMVSPTEWIRVETTEVAGETAAEIRRFRAAADERQAAPDAEGTRGGRGMSVRTARAAASSAITVDDLIEASRELDAEAVRAWVAERGEPLDLDADELARLADRGVEEEIIDVAVAVSFPDEFVVDRDARGYDRRGYDPGAPATVRGGYGGGLARRSYRDPYLSSYYYSPFGHRFGRFGWWYGGNRSTVVIVRPRDDGRGDARAVRGKGYTRGAPESALERDPDLGVVEVPSGGAVTPSGATSGGSETTDRKAKPRGGSSSDDDG